VKTPLTQQELAQNTIAARGVMSTVANTDSWWGVIQNALSSSERDTANLVATLWPPPPHHSKNKMDDQYSPILITCGDNGEPYALDPKTLETKGRLVDVVPKLKEVFPDGTKFLAHTRRDETKERFVMCTSKMEIPGDTNQGNVTMEFLEFDTNFDLVCRRSHKDRFMVVHDWVLTQNYYVVPKNPAYLKWPDLANFMLGRKVGTDIFAMEEETSGAFLLIPRGDNKTPNEERPVRTVESDAFFNLFHFGPTYENDNNELIVNGCVFDSYTFGGEMGFLGNDEGFDPISWGTSGMAPPPRLDQFVLDLNSFTLKLKTRVPVIPVDLPVFSGDAKPLRYAYFCGASRPEGWFPFRSILKVDLETLDSINWDAGDGSVVSEAMFVPKEKQQSAEDDGFVISIVHNAEESSCRLVIWDSQTFENGPIAECPLGDLIPWCVHGSFYPNYNPYKKNEEVVSVVLRE
jgi:all-trans-8'-apo-beta-carotenal 15,15'-oxygenase